MSEERKAPASVAAPTGTDRDFYHRQDIMGRPGLSRIFGIGRAAARTAGDIAAMLGTDPRRVTLQINALRLMGLPVCATSDVRRPGYFLPAGPGELAEYVQGLRRRLRAIQAVLAALERVLAAWTGQVALDGWEG